MALPAPPRDAVVTPLGVADSRLFKKLVSVLVSPSDRVFIKDVSTVALGRGTESHRATSYPWGHRPGVYGTPAASNCCSNFFSSVSNAFNLAISAFSPSKAMV